jgi:aspartyl-tRNA(Asn)/glutamyl-tRNA(Gln) amidotransferase subunit A
MTSSPGSLREAATLVEQKAISPIELTRACLDRIAAKNETLRAFITVMGEQALADAARAEKEIAKNRYRGPLHGIPVSVKDLVDIAGTPTTSGSAVPPRRPQHDATIISRLRAAGAIIVGKTNLHEFAYGTTSDETAFGTVRNPYDHSRSAGGSSAGAAVAIVEAMCYASVGTDTGGSIRIPAAACGITGLKPTHGEIPVDGVVPLSTTFDHVGPMARTVSDTALLYQGLREAEATWSGLPVEAEGPLWLGVPTPYFFDKLDGDVARLFTAARDGLAAAGHSMSEVSIAHVERTPDVYLAVMLAEASWYHAPLLRDHADKYSPGVRLRLEMGRYVLAEDYLRGIQGRAALIRSVDRALEGLDALLLPALAIPAPPLGATTVEVGGRAEPVRAMMLRLTQLFNVTGHPAIAIPCGKGTDGLPRAIQLVGHRGGTERLLEVATAVERQMIGGAGSVGGGTG